MTVIAELQGRIQAAFGLVPTPAWPAELERAAARVADRRGIPASALPGLTAHDPRLLCELAGELTIDESLFLRQPDHFEYLAEYVRARLDHAPADARLKLWSAGCSHGEEPYSAAIILEERLGPSARGRVDFWGTDLRHKAIEVARSGLFAPWSLRDAPAWLLARYLRADGGAFRLAEEIRAAVRFEQGAIGERLPQLADRSIDVLFFRNVAIYLEPQALRALYEGFARVLAADGLLFTATTDPRPPETLFELREHESESVWALRADARHAGRRERHAGCPPASSPRAADLLAVASALADRGESEEALRTLERLLESEPGRKAGHELRGRILLSLGRDQAAPALRRAVELAPADRLARYWYALALRAAGDSAGCLAQLEALRRRLSESESGEWLEDGVSRVEELARAARLLQEELE